MNKNLWACVACGTCDESLLHVDHMLHLLHMSVTCGTPSWVFPREIPWKSREEQAWTLWKWNKLLMTKIWIMLFSEDLESRMEFRVQFFYIVHWNMNMHQIQTSHPIMIFYKPKVNGSTVVRIKCSKDVLAEVFCIATGNSLD